MQKKDLKEVIAEINEAVEKSQDFKCAFAIRLENYSYSCMTNLPGFLAAANAQSGEVNIMNFQALEILEFLNQAAEYRFASVGDVLTVLNKLWGNHFWVFRFGQDVLETALKNAELPQWSFVSQKYAELAKWLPEGYYFTTGEDTALCYDDDEENSEIIWQREDGPVALREKMVRICHPLFELLFKA